MPCLAITKYYVHRVVHKQFSIVGIVFTLRYLVMSQCECNPTCIFCNAKQIQAVPNLMARYSNINRVNVETLFRPKPPYFAPKVFIKLIFNPEKRTTGVFSIVGLVCSGTLKVKYGSCDTSFLRSLSPYSFAKEL